MNRAFLMRKSPTPDIINQAIISASEITPAIEQDSAISLGPAPRLLRAFGETKPIIDWQRDTRCSVSRDILEKRLRRGWPAEDALTFPVGTTWSSASLTAFGETKKLPAWAADPRCVVPRLVLWRRIKEGWSVERALITPNGTKHTSSFLTAFGVRKSLSAWTRDPRCVVTSHVITKRLKLGWSPVEALTVPVGVRKHVVAPLRGTLDSQHIQQLLDAPECRVSRKMFATRIRAGWSVRDAITIPPHGRPPQGKCVVTAFGETKLLTAWARDPRCCVPAALVASRISTLKWDAERALTTPKLAKKPATRLLTILGETKSLAEWRTDPRCAVCPGTFEGRLKLGWDAEPALLTPRCEPHARCYVTAFGERKNVASWVRDPRCVVTLPTLHHRISAGWDGERALTTPSGTRHVSRYLTAFGETHSLAAWLRDPRCAVPSSTLRARLAAGLAPEDALTQPPSGPPVYGAFGETKTSAAWAADPRCVVSEALFLSRLHTTGWDVEKALTQPKDNPRLLLTAFGESKYLPEWLKDPRCRVTRPTLQTRLQAGWDPEKAIATPAGLKA
jgi:hypothetical protein